MWFVVITLLFGAFNARAASAFRMSLAELENEFFDSLNQAMNANLQKRMSNKSDYSLNGVSVASGCQIFIDANARLGDQGAYTINEIVLHSSEYPSLLADSALNEQCPNYRNLEVQQRAQLIALLLTAMAHFESSCRLSAVNPDAPNGTARGFFQLHQGHENEYDGRSDSCSRNASLDAEESIDCALGMLNLQFARSGLLFDPGSYWDVLRPKGEAQSTAAIGQALGRTGLCRLQ